MIFHISRIREVATIRGLLRRRQYADVTLWLTLFVDAASGNPDERRSLRVLVTLKFANNTIRSQDSVMAECDGVPVTIKLSADSRCRFDFTCEPSEAGQRLERRLIESAAQINYPWKVLKA